MTGMPLLQQREGEYQNVEVVDVKDTRRNAAATEMMMTMTAEMIMTTMTAEMMMTTMTAEMMMTTMTDEMMMMINVRIYISCNADADSDKTT